MGLQIMNCDFSKLNIEYLIQARDIAMADQQRAGAMLGIPDEMVRILPKLTPHLLATFTRIKHPLITPRQCDWWWSRLLIALQDGQTAEIEAVLDQAALILIAADQNRSS